MTFAILKLSYDRAGESPLTGGICGAAFLVGKCTAITAHHILSNCSLKPNQGFKKCQYWLLSRDGAIYELDRTQLMDYPGIDTTTIRLNTETDTLPLQISRTRPCIREVVYNEGFVAGAMPNLKAVWKHQRLQIERHSLVGVIADQRGFIRDIGRPTVRSLDVNLNGVTVIVTSYSGRKGMSGGPLVRATTNEVLGLMSFGLPPDCPIKEAVAAVSINEIESVVEIR